MRKSEKAKEDQLIFRNDIEKSRSKYNIEESLLKGINLPEHAKKHLKYLLKAILEVNYWKYVTPGSDVQKNGDKAIFKSFTERAFAYELYHQWRKVLETENEEDLILNGELSKR